jgi:hypothetical protein
MEDDVLAAIITSEVAALSALNKSCERLFGVVVRLHERRSILPDADVDRRGRSLNFASGPRDHLHVQIRKFVP